MYVATIGGQFAGKDEELDKLINQALDTPETTTITEYNNGWPDKVVVVVRSLEEVVKEVENDG